MRAPVVAGVGGGVGTTTVAVGLRGQDAGRLAGLQAGHRPDILVCRGTLDSVRRAADVLDEAGGEPPPVLAVTLAAGTPRGPLRARLDLLEADAAAVVLLPRVRRWITLVDPLAEVAQLLVEPADRLPRPVRAYAAALRELAAAVAASGRLSRGRAEDPAPVPVRDERPARRPGQERAARRPDTGFGMPAHGEPFHRPDPDGRPARREGRAPAGLPPLDVGGRRPRRGVQIVAAGRIEQAG
jgi:hypothetical protein